MLVTPNAAQRILAGRKVEHRLPRRLKAPEVGASLPVRTVVPDELGHDEPVIYCRVLVLSVREQTVAEVTNEDAAREGYRDRRNWLADWDHGDLALWAVAFEVERERRARFLSTGIIAGRRGDYVTEPALALRGEGEAVDADTLHDFVRHARERDAERLLAQRGAIERLPWLMQVTLMAAEARRRHIDVRNELRALKRYGDKHELVQQQLARLRGKLNWEAAA